MYKFYDNTSDFLVYLEIQIKTDKYPVSHS